MFLGFHYHKSMKKTILTEHFLTITARTTATTIAKATPEAKTNHIMNITLDRYDVISGLKPVQLVPLDRSEELKPNIIPCKSNCSKLMSNWWPPISMDGSPLSTNPKHQTSTSSFFLVILTVEFDPKIYQITSYAEQVQCSALLVQYVYWSSHHLQDSTHWMA